MTRKPSGVTATEVIERLKSDPGWVQMESRRKAKRMAEKERLDREQEPLIRDLAEVGCHVESVYDLVNSTSAYPEKAISVLLKHLKIKYDPKIREGIARALTTKKAKGSVAELIEAFVNDPDKSLNGAKSAIGNALDYVTSEKYIPEIVHLALDTSHGPARATLVRRLGRSKNVLAVQALQTLASDPDIDVGLRAKNALSKKVNAKLAGS